MRALRFTGLLAAALLTIAACGGGASPTASSAASNAPSSATAASTEPSAAGAACAKGTGTAAVSVSIKDFALPAVTAKVGQVIGFTNEDSAPHTATPNDFGDCGTDHLQKGQTGLIVFNTAGEYAYHCAVHPSMHGKITITQ